MTHGGVIDPFAAYRLGPVELPNRFVKAATFEGLGAKGLVTEKLVEFHRAVAAGGVGMTTLAYTAVSREGRGAPNEIVVRDEAAEGLTRLVEAVHAEGAAVSVQLGHAGPVAGRTGGRALAPSRLFSPLAMRFTSEITEDEMGMVRDQFVASSVILRDCGFDAIELHLGHNYLLSAFLSPALNRRTDRHGGPIARRAEYPRSVVRAVRAAVGDDVALIAKLNMADGYPGGIWLDESIEAARLLESDGCLDALQLTGGSSLRNPMYLFRGEAPIEEMADTFPRPMRRAFRLLGDRLMPSYPFEEAYFFDYARQFREALSMPLVLLGGITRRDTVDRALAAGFELVAMGRALLREPDLVDRWRAGDDGSSLCVHCNKCMPTIYSGTRCVLV